MSANIAYGQVNLEAERAGGASGEYEDPDKLARFGHCRWNYEPTEHPTPYELPVSKPEAPAYATAQVH